jgi:adenine-specific DNA-methyltransferase
MYPRLKLARNLLTDDGVIFTSIDEHEFNNLKKVYDEIFGEENLIEVFIWIKNSTKNLSKTTSTNHEYILCYSKNIKIIREKNFFMVEKDGLQEVNDILLKSFNNGLNETETENILKKFYKENNELKGISMYTKVEKNLEQTCYQVYTLSDMSAPKSTGKSNTYNVLHPKTKLPCKFPSRGWAFTQEKMDYHIRNNNVYFYDDETKIPRFKRYLDDVETEILKSTITNFKEGKKELVKLFGDAYFDNSKPTSLLKHFISLTNDDEIILDFFSGSGTTADAVLQSNSDYSYKRKFIMVQIPESTDEKSEAFKVGYKTLSEIGKERIIRAGDKIKSESNNK